MKNKKDNIDDLLKIASAMSEPNNIISKIFSSPEYQHDDSDLKNGFRLVPIEKEGFDNINNYSHLYKDGVKLSDAILRRGGFCSGFKDGFCQLIVYDNVKQSIGKDCILNEKGEIVFKAKENFKHVYHVDGVIASQNNKYYNLLTGEEICEGYDRLRTKEFIFIGSSLGTSSVYKINIKTGKYKIYE